MKKILAVCSLVILSLFSVGCAKVIELTDEENYLIAEYAAELLMKYDRNMRVHFYDSQEAEAVTTEELTTEEDTEEPLPEATGTITDASLSTTSGSSNVNADSAGVTADKNFDIGAFAGYTNVSIKYAYYMVANEYPSFDDNGVYMEIEAPMGYKLLILKFNVENLTDQEQSVDLYTKDLQYEAMVENQRGVKQMLTLLIDDLYTYQATLGANQLEEMVLLFQVPDSVSEEVKDLKLRIKLGNEEAVLQLENGK